MVAHQAILALVLSVLLLASPRAQEAQQRRGIQPGQQMPPFSVTTTDGATLSSTDFQGRVLLVIFVRPEQQLSVDALRSAETILEAEDTGRLSMLAVSSQPGSEQYFDRIAGELSLSFPITQDPERVMYGDCGLIVTPTTLLIDEAGTVRYKIASVPTSFGKKLQAHTQHVLGKITAEEHDLRLLVSPESEPQATAPREAKRALAERLIGKREWAQAQAVLEELHQDGLDAPAETALLGRVYLRLGRVEQAEAVLASVALTPESPPAVRLAWARLELQRHDLDLAEQHLQAGLKAAPRDGALLFELGRLFEQSSRPDQALDCYRQALESIFDGEV